MRVIYKPTGQLGEIPDDKYDPSIFEAVQAQSSTARTPVQPQVNASMTPTTQSDPEQEVRSGLLNTIGQGALGIGKSLLQPFKGVAADTFDIGKYIVGGEQSFGPQYQNPLRSEQDLVKTRNQENPAGFIEDQARNTAGIASYAVPFGKAGFVGSKFIAPGVASGGLATAAQPDTTLPEIVGGAVVGGVTGGVMQGAGKAYSALSRGGKAVDKAAQTNILNPQAKATPFYSTEIAKLEKTASDLGLMKGSARSRLDKMPGIFKNIETKIRKKLSGVTNPVDDTLVEGNFDTMLSKNSTFSADDPALLKAREQVLERYKNLGGTGGKTSTTVLLDAAGNPMTPKVTPKTATQVYNFKSELRGELSNALEKLEKGNLNLSPVEEAKLAMYRALKTSLDKVAEGTRALNDTEHYMFDLSEGLVKSSKKTGGIDFGAIKIPLMPNRMKQGLQSFGGQVAGKAGDIMSGTLPPIGQNIVGQSGVRSVVGTMAETSNQDPNNNYSEDPSHASSVSSSVNIDQQRGQMPPITGRTVEEHAQAMAAAIANNDTKSAEQIGKMLEVERNHQKDSLTTSKQVPAAQVTELADIQDSVNMMNGLGKVIDQYSDVIGPIQGRLKGVNPYDTKAQDFQSQMVTVAQVVGKALEGGVLRQEDTVKYLKILPQITDTKETALAKIQNVQKLLENKKKTREEYFKGAGYDTKGGVLPPITQPGGTSQSFNSPAGGEKDPVALIKKYFPQDQWNNAYAIMMAETGGQNVPSTFNQQGTEDSHGYFQINLHAHPQMAGKVYDPEENVKYAAQLYRENGWMPWYNSARKVGLLS